jgi:hypothetical protein
MRTLSVYHLAIYALLEEHSLEEVCKRSDDLFDASITARKTLTEHELKHGCGFSRAQQQRAG